MGNGELSIVGESLYNTNQARVSPDMCRNYQQHNQVRCLFKNADSSQIFTAALLSSKRRNHPTEEWTHKNVPILWMHRMDTFLKKE